MLLHFRVSVLFNVISLTLFVASSVTLVCVLVGLSNNILLFFMAMFDRLLASDTSGVISVWDRRMSTLPCLELTTNSQSTLNSIELNVENQVSYQLSQPSL